MTARLPYGMRIGAIAAYAPPNRVKNRRIAARLRLERMRVRAHHNGNGSQPLDESQLKVFSTSDRWIRRFIGFSERRFADDHEATIDLATRAAQLLLENTGLKPGEIDAIVFGSVTPSYLYSPPDSILLQDRLGIPSSSGDRPRETLCMDISVACSTWVVALRQAYLLISSGAARNVLVIGADKMSSTINWRDRAFATVLGDAGTATWCTAVPPEEDWFGHDRFWNWADGHEWEIIKTPVGGSAQPVESADDLREYRHRLSMDGAMVKQLIVPLVGGPGIDAALRKTGWSLKDVDLATLHEANLMLNRGIIEQWEKRGFSGKLISADGRFGNTTSASIPLALALHGDELQPGRRFVWFAFGGGLSAASVLGEIRHPVVTVTSV